LVDDKEICAEMNDSDSDDDEFELRRALKDNENFRAFVQA